MLEETSLEENERFKRIYGPRYGIELKWKVEMRIKSDGKKVWLGSYKTPKQAARANDAGKFFFSTTVESNYSFPKTPGILLPFSTVMGQLSRHKEMKLVQEMARLYANMGERMSEIFVGWEVGFRAGVYSAEPY